MLTTPSLSLALLLLSSFALSHSGPSRANRHGLGMEKRVAQAVRMRLEKRGLVERRVEGEENKVVLKRSGKGKCKIRTKTTAVAPTTTTAAAPTTTTEAATAAAVVANKVGGQGTNSASFTDDSNSTPVAGRHSSHPSSVLATISASIALPTSSTSPSSQASSTSSSSSSSNSGCFPISTTSFPSGTPSSSRDDWWCSQSQLYGFLGFSYPMEVANCDDYSNSYESISKDMKRMKSEFGATMLRVYAPECRSVSVWENLVKAGRDNGMGVIALVWWGFGDQSLWKQTQSSIYELFTTSSLASIAPYVIHSASFGSEPIGDGVDGGNFINDLASFRSKMNGFGIPVGISEDWDRWGTMSAQGGLGPVGKQVKDNTDITHAHIMPYYHSDQCVMASDAWAYIEKQLAWLSSNVGQPTLVTGSMWASFEGTHGRGAYAQSISTNGYQTYWEAFSNNCQTFKKYQTGWFIHTWSDAQEAGFGMIDSSGNSKIPGYYPKKC